MLYEHFAGRRIGDLYTLPIRGGRATRITSGMAFDSQPRYSPDGSKIVFLSDRSGDENIWTANPDGSDPRPLTKGRNSRYWSPEWTPDGKYIIVSRSGAPPGGTQLWLYHVDGGSGINLTGSEERRQLNPLGAAFGKDDRFVYLTERTAAGSVYNQMSFRWQLGVYDRQTGENFRMSDDLGSAMRPVLSPDGRWLVYATRWDAQTVTRISPFRAQGQPHFARDPDRIYAWEGSRGLVSFRWDGTDRRAHVKVTGYRDPNAAQASNAGEVIMGPDGEHAIAEAQRHIYILTVPVKGGEPPTIALANPDNAAVPVRKLTTVGGEFLSWAEDGRSVTFALGRTLFKYDLEAGKVDQKTYRPAETEVVVEASRAKAAGTVLLRGARILTMATSSEVIEKGEILIKDNRIEEIGRRGQIKAPAGARTIDVSKTSATRTRSGM